MASVSNSNADDNYYEDDGVHPPVNKFRQQSPLLAFEMCFDSSSTSLQLRLLFCTPLQSLGAKGGARTLGGPLKEGCQVQ